MISCSINIESGGVSTISDCDTVEIDIVDGIDGDRLMGSESEVVPGNVVVFCNGVVVCCIVVDVNDDGYAVVVDDVDVVLVVVGVDCFSVEANTIRVDEENLRLEI